MNQRIKRIYCDTSVYGGVFDSEFQRASRKFFELVRLAEFQIITSPIVDAEITDALTPGKVQDFYNEMLALSEIVEINDAVIFLQEEYLNHKILTPKWIDDALHMACATIHACDMIVSWNFKHIVNYKKIPLYNAVNLIHGYKPIEIYSPLEVIENDQ